jgi:hypothetical protein
MQPHTKKLHWLFYILAFIVANVIIFFCVTAQPKFSLRLENQEEFKSVTIHIQTKGILPTKSVTATLADQPLALEKVDRNHYTTTVKDNGTLLVNVTNFNGMQQSRFENIVTIDNAAPTITGEVTKEGVVTLLLDDSQSGINYDGLYGIDGNGHRLLPTSIDHDNEKVVFQYSGGKIDVHAVDNIGNESTTTFYDKDAKNSNIYNPNIKYDIGNVKEQSKDQSAQAYQPTKSND